MDATDPNEVQPDLLTPRPAPGTPPPAEIGAAVEYLHQQAQDLRTLFTATFVGLIFLTLGINLFIGKQMRMVHAQLSEQRPQMQRVEGEFRKRDPEFKRFVSALQQFGVTHPDYAPLINRYRNVLPQYFPGIPALSGKPDPGASLPAAPAR